MTFTLPKETKKILCIFFIFSIFFMAIMGQSARAIEIAPKVQALAIVTLYGTGGGALLGLASMAFGGRARAIAQGASLGLYAGLAFGSYIIYSYETTPRSPYTDYPEYQYDRTNLYDKSQYDYRERRWEIPKDPFKSAKILFYLPLIHSGF